MEHQVFLSYSTKDAVFSEKLYDYLTRQGLVCWMAPKSIAPGSEYGEAIIAGIEQAKVFVLVYSEHSNQSQHVLREVERCVNKNTPLIAYEIAAVQPTKSMEYFLMANQWMQAVDAPERHMQELYEAIMVQLGRGQDGGQTGNTPETEPQNTESKKQPQRPTEAPTKAKGNITRRVWSRKAAVCGVLLLAAAAAVFVCVRNPQTGCGGDVPDEVSGNLLGEGENATGNGMTGMEKANQAEAETAASDGAYAHGKTDAAETDIPLSLKPGEYITFGRYYPQGQEDAENAQINWIVLSVNAQEKTALLLAEKIIDMKPYDVAESGVYGRGADGVAYDRTRAEEYSASALSVFYGNSSWEYSNLRAWLNSADSVVSYHGQEPVSKGTDDGVNGYQNQAGFLYDFTEKELGRLVVTPIETSANAIENESVTNDRVFLLSVEEAQMYLDAQKLSRYAAPTDAAVAASRGTLYPLYHSYAQETIPWYFRTPVADSAHEIMLCGSGFEGEDDVIVKYSCSAGAGVRPVVVVKLEEGELSGEGTRIHPYKFPGE